MKKRVSDEQRKKEVELIKLGLSRKGMTQQELAVAIGKDQQSEISPWLSLSSGKPIPDGYFLKMARVLDFDPSLTRPALLDVYQDMLALWSDIPETPEKARKLILDAARTLPESELMKLAGMLEMLASQSKPH